jgi:GAF domain-containing protein
VDGVFTKEDETFLTCVLSQAAVALRNSKLYHEVVKHSERSNSMLGVLHAFASQLNVDEAIKRVVQHSISILDAERLSFYLVDEAARELVCKISQDVSGLRIPLSCGLAGYVARSGETVNIEDAYRDDRFNSQVDLNTGFRTRCVIASPIMNNSGKVIAVLQAINKKSTAAFNGDDEEAIKGITRQASVAIQNAQLFEAEERARKKNQALVEVAKAVSSELHIHSLVAIIMREARSLLNADRCSLFLLDHEAEELWSVAPEGHEEIRFSMRNGVAGQVVSDGKPINIADAYKSEHFNAEVDMMTGYKTKSILAYPIRNNHTGEILGVVEMINKKVYVPAADASTNEKKADGGNSSDEAGGLAHPNPANPYANDGEVLESDLKIMSRAQENYNNNFGNAFVSFTEEDKELLNAFTSVAAVALSNSTMFQELKAKSNYVENTLQSISNFVFTLDSTGRLTTANHSLEELFGRSERTLREKPYQEWLTDANEQFRTDIAAVYETGKPVFATDYRLNIAARGDKQAQRNTVQYKISPLLGDNQTGSVGGGTTSTASSPRARKPFKSYDDRLDSISPNPTGGGDPLSPTSPADPFQQTSRTQTGVVIILEDINERKTMENKLKKYKKRLRMLETRMVGIKDHLQIVSESPIQHVIRTVESLIAQQQQRKLRRSSTDYDSLSKDNIASSIANLSRGNSLRESTTHSSRRDSLEMDDDSIFLVNELEDVLACLQSSDLYKPAFMGDGVAEDADNKDTELAKLQHFLRMEYIGAGGTTANRDGGQSSEFITPSGSQFNSRPSSAASANSRPGRCPNCDGSDGSGGGGGRPSPGDGPLSAAPALPRTLPGQTQRSDEDIAHFQSWEFDCLPLSDAELTFRGIDIFEQLRLVSNFKLNVRLLHSFMEGVQRKYRNNPFHNFHHGFSVMHISFLCLTTTCAGKVVENLDQLALCIAALGHDLDHPGVNNAFLINSGHELAMRYNDHSVLENHHCAMLYSILSEPSCNFLSHFAVGDRKEIRRKVISAILATDMSVHFELVTKMSTVLAVKGSLTPETELSVDDKQLFLNMIVHSADLSNPVRRPFEVNPFLFLSYVSSVRQSVPLSYYL